MAHKSKLLLSLCQALFAQLGLTPRDIEAALLGWPLPVRLRAALARSFARWEQGAKRFGLFQ